MRTCAVGGEQRLDLGDELAGRHVRASRATSIESSLPSLLKMLLRGREVEDRERRAAERAARPPKRTSADDAVLLHRAAREHADRVADLEVLLARGLRVDRDLVRAAGQWPLDEHERVEALVAVRIDAEREARRAAARDHLVVATDELRLVGDAALGDARRPGSARTFAEQRLRERRRVTPLFALPPIALLPVIDGVGVLVDLR